MKNVVKNYSHKEVSSNYPPTEKLRTYPSEDILPDYPQSDTRPSSLRILIVVEPGMDGVFRHVESLVTYLIDQGQEVHLAYSDRRGSPELTTLVRYVEASGFKTVNLKVSSAPGIKDIRALQRLTGLVGQVRPQIVHSHSSKAGVLGRTLALLGKKSAQFYTPHAYYGMASKKGLKPLIYNRVERHFASIGQTIHISRDERNFAVKKLGFPPQRSVLIPNAVATDHFVPTSAGSRAKIREEFGIPSDVPVLGAMGRLSFQKDAHTLYRAFALTLERGMQCHLLHVGQGEEEQELAGLASSLGIGKHLTRVPYLRQPLKFYQAIDGLILTSRYEGCPLVALEALSCDLPLILSEAPGVNWLGESGLSHTWTAPVGDASAFADAIIGWARDRSENRPIDHRQFAIEHFSPDKQYNKILGAYRSAADTASFA